MLKDIKRPDQLKGMSVQELEALAEEIRKELVRCVSENGGHLASNLGIVELTLAIHYVFDCPKDKIVFDVGHQAYVHKMLTGRLEGMRALRKKDGLSGFPDPEESEYDCFAAGHASNAISAALGMLRGGEKNRVVTIVGDGALNGGMCYEALNDAGQSEMPMIVILNDNEMSISKNVGAISFYLDSLRRTRGYQKMKRDTKSILARIPLIGQPLRLLAERIHDSVKALFIKGGFFEALGFNYIGPIDGHDIKKLIRVLTKIRNTKEPILLHVATQKGKGYVPAENAPTSFHGVAPFYIDSGMAKKEDGSVSYGQEAARLLSALADSDPNICVVCAAMMTGTGMEVFEQHHKDRFFDVGIAEEHAVTMAAGLASEGKHPYVAIYSTFLQRGYDQMMIDVCRNGYPVTFLLDRAGLTGADGRTHQGLYDISYLRSIPGMTVASARDIRMLRKLVRFSTKYNKPLAIRYSKETADIELGERDSAAIRAGQWEEIMPGNDAVIIAEGAAVRTALNAAIRLAGMGISCGVTDACFLKPIDEAYLDGIAKRNTFIVTIEENTLIGGLGSAVASALTERDFKGKIRMLGAPDAFVRHASVKEQRVICGIDEDSVVNKIIHELGEKQA